MELLQLEFMRRALVAALLVGVTAPAIGVFLVQRRLALLGDGIGHVAFLGVAAGLFLGTSPVATGIVAASLAGAVIEVLREKGRLSGDVALAVILYGGVAGGALLTFLSDNPNLVLGYLFGSVLTVTGGDLWVLAAAAAVVLTSVTLVRKELFAVCYDEEVARASGLPVRKLNMFMALASALTVGVTMRVVGVLLVSAMLVLPVAIVQQLSESFRSTVRLALLAGGALSGAGVVASYYFDTSPGATIVVLAIAVFAAASLAARSRAAAAA